VIGFIGAPWRRAMVAGAPAPPYAHRGPTAPYREAGKPPSNTRTVLPAGG
jgi:hypothetical protein